MPELPEVQTVVTTLSPRIVGKRVRRVILHRTDVITPTDCNLAGRVEGRQIDSIQRRGKRIVFTLDDGNRFYIHLGMTGRLTLETADQTLKPHTHVIFQFDDVQIHFRDPRRFGGIWWLGTENPAGNMGPEPLALRPEQLARRLARMRRPIKAALLDQSVIAGLGNIYVDESLFMAGIHPLALTNELTPEQIQRLNRAIKFTLRKAIRHRGSTLRDYVDGNGARGGFQLLHNVYGRAKEPCRTCKTPIERIVLGERSTHFCPACQRTS